MIEKSLSVRRVWAACALALGVFGAPLALAGNNTSECDSIANPMQRAQCRCTVSMSNYNEQTASIIPQIADNNPYLQQVKNAQPGNNSSLGVPGVAQSCNGMTKSAFDSALGSLGGFLGFNISGVLGPIANATEGTICQSINNAIMQRTTIACPRVSVPGFPINCSGSLGVNSSGVQVNGSGVFGGARAGGSSSTGLGGVTNANGSFNNGAPGGAVSGQTTVSAPAAAGGGGIASTIACWISGSCP